LILPPGQVTHRAQERYLGIPIGQQVDYTPTWLELEKSIMQRIVALKRARHDTRSRVIISKSLLYSKVHFLARFTPVPPLILKRIEKWLHSIFGTMRCQLLTKLQPHYQSLRGASTVWT